VNSPAGVTSNPEPPTSEKVKPPRKSWREWLHAKLPTEGKLHGTFAHRVFGDRIFHSDLWRFTRNGVAIGLAAGVFATLIPIFGLHIFLAVIGAFVFRGNIPCAILVCFTVGNPFALMAFMFWEWKLGQLIFGHGPPPAVPVEAIATFGAAAHGFKRAMREVIPLMAGGTLIAIAGATVTYFATHALWGFFTHTPPLPPKLADEKPPESLP
jgi:uncharacterized protein (DUF2062 family)